MKSLMMFFALAATATAADPSAAVVRLNYPGGTLCSGVSVEGGYILTAEHCGCGDNVTVTFRDGTKLKASTAHDPEKNGRDQVIALKLDSKAPATVPIADRPVQKGQTVRSYGYPAGKWSINEGVVTSMNERFTSTDFFILEGNSGGGLFNEQGELIGIASARNDLGGEPGSHYVSLDEIHLTMNAVGRKPASSDYTKSNEVVIFTTPGCGPCDRLKQDIAAGHFKAFKLRMVEYRAGVWSDQELADEMWKSIPPGTSLAFPLIWVRGTENFRVGYSPDRRGGLIGFLSSVLDGIGMMILGPERTPAFPQRPGGIAPVPEPPGSVPRADLGEPAPAPAPPSGDVAESELKKALDSVREDLEKLKSANPLDKIRGAVAMKEDLADLKGAMASNEADAEQIDILRKSLTMVMSDVATLKDGNPIEKIKALSSLKSEVETLKVEASDIRDRATDDPWLFVLGLPGLLSGLLHRRMAA